MLARGYVPSHTDRTVGPPNNGRWFGQGSLAIVVLQQSFTFT